MYRTHHCGELNSQFVTQNVTLAGWVQTIRKFGAITFVDLIKKGVSISMKPFSCK